MTIILLGNIKETAKAESQPAQMGKYSFVAML